MMLRRLILALLPIALLIAIPLFLARESVRAPSDRRFLVIVTPHNEQIRAEFREGFIAWHARVYGELVEVQWDLPGGTSEITRLLEARHRSALQDRRTAGDTDLLFGGGSYEFSKLATPFAQGGGLPPGEPILAIATLPDGLIAQAFPEATIGGRPLYHQERRWFATALSTFGIIFNRDPLGMLHVPEPESWSDLADPRLAGWIAMTNPDQSGSVLTTFETILLRAGWHDGWRVLRRAAANARSISASSSDIPKRVASGSCAMGVCIDFFARTEAAVAERSGAAGADRIGFVAPRGQTVVDPDPIAMLTGAREPELAARFIEFCLSRDGQALWQFRRRAEVDGLAGPVEHELRRLPARRDMFSRYHDSFRDADAGDPFADASPLPDTPHVRSLIGPIFAASAVRVEPELKRAWHAIINHPAYPEAAAETHAPVVTAADVDDPVLRRWLQAFDSFPEVPGPGGRMYSLGSEGDLKAIADGWLRGGWASAGLWASDEDPKSVLRNLLAADARTRCLLIIREAEELGIPTDAPARARSDADMP